MSVFKSTATGVAVITPFNNKGAVDFDALSRIIHYLIDSGIDFLVALGTTGESVTLTNEERNAVFSTFVSEVNGKVPLVMGLGGNNTQSLVSEFTHIDTKGFDAILSVTPYYNRPSQEGLYRHFMALDAVTKLPIIMYNVPARTGVNMTAATTLRLDKESNNIIGIKDASGDLSQGKAIIENSSDDFIVYSGDDETAIELTLLGGDGVISVAAGCFPITFSQGIQAALAGNTKEAEVISARLNPAVNLLFQEGNPAGIKAVSKLKGLSDDSVRLPLVKASDALVEALQPFAEDLD